MKELACFLLAGKQIPGTKSVAAARHRRKAKIGFSRSTDEADTDDTRIPGGRDGPGHLVSG